MKNPFRNSRVFGFVVLMLPLFACAHPGHGPGEVPPQHLLSADHGGLVLVLGVITFCMVRAVRWRHRGM